MNLKYFLRFSILILNIFIFQVLPGFAQATNLFRTDTVLSIHLKFYDAGWRKQLAQFKKEDGDSVLPATIEIDGVKIDSIGVKFKGNSSFKPFYKKNPYTLKFDYYHPKMQINGLTALKLSNIFKDPSAIREVLGYEIYREFMPASRAAFAELYINDTLYGLYTYVEPINKNFLERQFGTKKGAFFNCDFSGIAPAASCPVVANGLTLGFTEDTVCYYPMYEMESKHGWTQLLELMKCLWYNSDSTGEYFNSIEKMLDVDQVLWMLAIDNIFVNLDSYIGSCHNYYLYRNKSGQFNPVVWDMNQCFGDFHHGFDLDNLYSLPVFLHIDNIYKPLVSKLLIVPEYKKSYLAHCRTLLEKYTENSRLEKRAAELQSLIRPFILRDPWYYYPKDFFDSSLYRTYKMDDPGIMELMNARFEFLKKQLEFSKEKPEIASPNLKLSGKMVHINVGVTGAKNAYFAYRLQACASFTKIPLFDDGLHRDNKSGDGLFGNEINMPDGPVLFYYIYAENKLSAAFLPEGAERQLLELKLEH